MLCEEEAQGTIEYIIPAAGVIVAAVAMFAIERLYMSFNLLVLATIMVYVFIGLSFTLIRSCDRDIRALRCQREEIKLGIARLKKDVNL